MADEKDKKKDKIFNLKSKKLKLWGTVAVTVMAVDYCSIKKNQLVPQIKQEEVKREEYIKQLENENKELLRSYPVEVDAKEILNNYANTASFKDEEIINNLYENKYIEVNGIVGEIIDQDTVILANEDNTKWYSEWMGIRCNFEETELDKIKQLKSGDDVIVSGFFNGYAGMEVELNDCIFNKLK